MKTLSDIATNYDEWARANEASAEQIMSSLDSFDGDTRDNQRWRAGWLMAEASELRARAAALRKVEHRRSIKHMVPTNVPRKKADTN